ncbi:unnamed protein product [Closterium sp. NIES-54]
MVHQVLQRFGFQFSLPQPTPLSTSHSLLAPPSDESVEPSGPYPELVGCLMLVVLGGYGRTDPLLNKPFYPNGLVVGILSWYQSEGLGFESQCVHFGHPNAGGCQRSTGDPRLILGKGYRLVVLGGYGRTDPLLNKPFYPNDASWVDDSATQRSTQGYTFSLGSSSVSWRSTHSSSVLSSSCEAEIYAGAMAAQELRWLTYLLTDLGEQPRSPPVLYVDNKAMIALCQEHRLEQRTKHIALQYFLARELQQCGQLRLAYMASRANTADIFTKALPPGDHQRFATVLGLGMITVLLEGICSTSPPPPPPPSPLLLHLSAAGAAVGGGYGGGGCGQPAVARAAPAPPLLLPPHCCTQQWGGEGICSTSPTFTAATATGDAAAATTAATAATAILRAAQLWLRFGF